MDPTSRTYLTTVLLTHAFELSPRSGSVHGDSERSSVEVRGANQPSHREITACSRRVGSNRHLDPQECEPMLSGPLTLVQIQSSSQVLRCHVEHRTSNRKLLHGNGKLRDLNSYSMCQRWNMNLYTLGTALVSIPFPDVFCEPRHFSEFNCSNKIYSYPSLRTLNWCHERKPTSVRNQNTQQANTFLTTCRVGGGFRDRLLLQPKRGKTFSVRFKFRKNARPAVISSWICP